MTTADYQRRYERLRRLVDRRCDTLAQSGAAGGLHEGCAYVLTSGGKRVRAVITMLACEAVGGNPRDALYAGTALELMHNFTLVHDDIMDHAPTRRGRPTVHTVWGVNAALLVGDILMGLAYQDLARTTKGNLRALLETFTRGLVEVCVGQAMDLDLEKRVRVRLDEYAGMIDKKTGALLVAAAECGAIVGSATTRQRSALRRFGRLLGRAFQMQDDLLDVVADQKRFGKTIGGDIVEGKKTFLLLAAASRARGADKRLISAVMKRGASPPAAARESEAEKAMLVRQVSEAYESMGVTRLTRQRIAHDTRAATEALKALPETRASDMLKSLAEHLVHRVS